MKHEVWAYVAFWMFCAVAIYCITDCTKYPEIYYSNPKHQPESESQPKQAEENAEVIEDQSNHNNLHE